jgi:hypothetical protein
MTYKQNSIIRMIPITVAPKTIAAAVPTPTMIATVSTVSPP